jgi:Rod binding domain-containing protein
MLKAMRNTVLKSDLLHRDVSEDIYNSMFDQEITRNISDGKGIGISSMIFQQLKVSNGFGDIIKEDEDNG